MRSKKEQENERKQLINDTVAELELCQRRLKVLYERFKQLSAEAAEYESSGGETDEECKETNIG